MRRIMIPRVEADLDAEDVDAPTLRRRLGRLLSELAQRLEPALTEALKHAAVAWDAFDEVSVLNPALEEEASWLATLAGRFERESDPEKRAIGVEVRIALESALGLIQLVERRLATVVRLRLQSGEPSLLPGERPFLDIAAALAEAARGWA